VFNRTKEDEMDDARARALSRRTFQKLCLSLPGGSALALAGAGSLAGWRRVAAQARPDTGGDDEASPEATRAVLPPTPECDDDDEPTVEQTEGPFYTPDTPKRTSFREEGLVGDPLTVTGYVLSTACEPVPGALVDFWHCDDAGVYDNEGFKLRGHQFTDAEGIFFLETIVPGLYPGRTRHIHVKVQAPNSPVLTTQLYFPSDEEENARDGIFNSALLMDVEDAEEGEGEVAFFNFALEIAEE
jgi:protocatechuate 3,4-dioxygenase beta subunit